MKTKHHPIIVYPSKAWVGSIDIPIGLPKGTIYVSVETLKRSSKAARKRRDKIFRQQHHKKQRRRRHRTWRQYWKSENGQLLKAVLISILVILIVAFLGETIRIARQEWWYAHHSVEEMIEGRD